MSATVAAKGMGLELVRLLAALAWVTATAAVGLAVLGAAPGWILGERRDVRLVASVDEAERVLGARLAIPTFFPSSLAWPPTSVRVAGGRGGGAELVFVRRSDGRPAVVLQQSTTPGEPIPAPLAAGRTELTTSRTTVGPRPAVRSRVLVEGEPWEELAWERDGRRLVLRTRGDLEELFRMAHSAHREGKP